MLYVLGYVTLYNANNSSVGLKENGTVQFVGGIDS